MTDDDTGSDGILRALRPPGSAGYLNLGDDPRADAMLQQIMTLEDRRWRAKHPGRVIVLVVAGTAVVGATAAAAIVLTRSAGNATALACYSSADVDRAVQVAIEPDGQRPPVAQCADLWSDGRIDTRGAPALVACVTPADIVAVVPGDDSTCATVGWVAADIATDAQAGAEAQLNSRLSGRFAGQCLTLDGAARAVEEVLDQLRLEGWSVSPPAPEAQGCIVPAVDAGERSIDLVAVP